MSPRVFLTKEHKEHLWSWVSLLETSRKVIRTEKNTDLSKYTSIIMNIYR